MEEEKEKIEFELDTPLTAGTYHLDDVEVTIAYNGDTKAPLTPLEVLSYIDRARSNKPSETLHCLHLSVIGDEIECKAHYQNRPFERIRRITGYLVGTLDRFNNAKRAEVAARVKHMTVDTAVEEEQAYDTAHSTEKED